MRTRPSLRNRTIFTAIWLLAAVALIEVILAAIALVPRFISGMRSEIAIAAPGSASSTESSTPANPPSSPPTVAPATSLLQSNSLESSSSLRHSLKDQAEGATSQQSSSDSMMGEVALQIINVKVQSFEDGSKKLQIGIKVNPQMSIDANQVVIQIYFYDEENGEIVPSKAATTQNWLHWQTDSKEPQLLEVQYQPDSTTTDIKFVGYVIALYYKGDLQDYRADPLKLKKLFEPKYYIGSGE